MNNQPMQQRTTHAAPKCGAPTRAGHPCKNSPIRGRTRCRMHNGKAKSGAESATFKHGRYSKAMPQKLMRAHEVMEADSEYLNLKRIAALRHVFILERLESLEAAPDPAEVWHKLQTLCNALEAAYLSEDSAGMRSGLLNMRSLISERVRYHMTRNEVESALNDQRKDITDLAQIEYRGENAVPANQVVALMAAVLHLITDKVSSKAEQDDVIAGIDSLLRIPERVE